MGIDLDKSKGEAIQDFIAEGRWEVYEEDVEVKIRPSTPKVVRDLQAKCERWRRGSKVVDDEKFEHLLRRHMVADWKGVLAKGKPAECNQANIDHVFDTFIEFASWIVEKSNQTGRDIEQEVKAKKENFTPTSGAPGPTSS